MIRCKQIGNNESNSIKQGQKPPKIRSKKAKQIEKEKDRERKREREGVTKRVAKEREKDEYVLR